MKFLNFLKKPFINKNKKYESLQLFITLYSKEIFLKIFSEKKLLFYKKFFFDKNFEISKISSKLEKYDFNNFTKICLIIKNNKFCLIPSVLKNTENINKILKYSLDYNDVNEVIKKNIIDDDILIIFPVQNYVLNSIKNFLKKDDISVYHQEFFKISMAINFKNQLKVSNITVVSLNEKDMHISVFIDDKLYFHNFFQFDSFRKSAYYLSSIINTLKLNTKEKIIFYGEKKCYNEIYRCISKYYDTINCLYQKITQ